MEHRPERRRPGVPAPAADGRLGPTGADQRLDLPEAGRHHRHAERTSRPPNTSAVDQERLLPRGHQRDRVHRRQRPLRQGRGRVHLQRRLAERRLRQGHGGQRRVLRCCRPREAGGTARGDVGPVDLRHRRQGRRTRTAPRSSSTGSPPTTRRARSTSPSAVRTPAVRPTADPAVAAGSVTNETLAAGPVVGKRTARWTSSPTRPARSSPRAGHPNSRRWSAASRTLPDCSRPFRPSTNENWPAVDLDRPSDDAGA